MMLTLPVLCFRGGGAATTRLAVMLTWLSAVSSSSSSSFRTTATTDLPLLRFDLQPTSALVVEQQRRRQRQRRRQQQEEDSGKLLLEEGEDDEDDTAVSYPDAWFHPYSRGVYAATATTTATTTTTTDTTNSRRRTGETELELDLDTENENDSNNDYHYKDFVTYRHLSRYEQEFRTTFALQLYPNWDGRYVPSTNNNNTTNNTPTTTGGVPFVFYDYTNDTVIMEHLLRRRTTQKKKEQNEDETETTTVLHPNATTTTKKKSHDRRSVRFPSRWTPYSRRSLEYYQQQQQQQHQGVPLVQGYGTHYVHIWVGTPIPQRQSVIVDTGSHYTGFPCQGCNNCGERYHTDPYYDPTKSQSFHPLQCPNECLGSSNTCEKEPFPSMTNTTREQQEKKNKKNSRHQRCRFTQAYTEGSSWTAYQARDVLYCGNGQSLVQAVSTADTHYTVTDFVFGCMVDNTGLFTTQLAAGILGLSWHERTLPYQLYQQHTLRTASFGLCFRKELGTSKRGITAGSMTLGGTSIELDTSPMVYAQNIAQTTQTHANTDNKKHKNYNNSNDKGIGWYTVYIQHIYVSTKGGTQFLFDTPESVTNNTNSNSNIHTDIVPITKSFDPAVVNQGRGVIVDSGTTDSYLSSSIREEFMEIWKAATEGKLGDYTNGALYLTQKQVQQLPTILLQLQVAERSSNGYDDKHLRKTKRPVLGQVGYLDPTNWSDVLVAIPATSYMEYSPTLNVYTSRLFFTESRGGVLGANTMQGHNVIFDAQRIGFAQSSCNYDLINNNNNNNIVYDDDDDDDDDDDRDIDANDEDNRGNNNSIDNNEGILAILPSQLSSLLSSTASAPLRDGRSNSNQNRNIHRNRCVLNYQKPPILSQSCYENIRVNNNIAICEASNDPTNVEVVGTEIWALQIERILPPTIPISQNNDSGTSSSEDAYDYLNDCEDAMKEWSESQDTINSIPDININGNGDGSSTGGVTTSCNKPPYNGSDNIVGLCQEYRPCHVPCMEAIKYKKMKDTSNSSNASIYSPLQDVDYDNNVGNYYHYDEAVTIPEDLIESKSSSSSSSSSSTSSEKDEKGQMNACNDWLWSVCDDSCYQSRIISKKEIMYKTKKKSSTTKAGKHHRRHHFYSTNTRTRRYCVESYRETRPCHVDLCGRNDPCIVPFLVHSIFIFEYNNNGNNNDKVNSKLFINNTDDSHTSGVDTNDTVPLFDSLLWTPAMEELFCKKFTLAAHHFDVISSDTIQRLKTSNSTSVTTTTKGTKASSVSLFGEGDVHVLVARPWYGDDDDDDNENNDDVNINIAHNGNGDGNGNGNHTETGSSIGGKARGIQLILQIAISNPKALRRYDPHQHQHRQQQQEEVEEQYHNNEGEDHQRHQQHLHRHSNSQSIANIRNSTSSRLLQEVGVTWTNLTRNIVLRKPKPTISICDSFELYPIAEIAYEISDTVVRNRKFLDILSNEMSSILRFGFKTGDISDGTDRNKMNSKVNNKEDASFLSARLVSSWTIETLNYYDTTVMYHPAAMVSTPMILVLKTVHEIFVIIVTCWIGFCVYKSSRLFRVFAIRLVKNYWDPNFVSYDNLSQQDDDDDNEEDVTTATAAAATTYNEYSRKRDNNFYNAGSSDSYDGCNSSNSNKNGQQDTGNTLSLSNLSDGSCGSMNNKEVELTATYLRSKATKRRTSTTFVHG